MSEHPTTPLPADSNAATNKIGSEPAQAYSMQPPTETLHFEPAPTLQNSRKRTIVLSAIIASAVLVAAVIGGELYARNKFASELQASLQCDLKTDADISLSAKPALLQWIDGKVPSLSIHTNGDRLGDAMGMQVDATLTNIVLNDTATSVGTIGQMDAEVNWTTEGITQTLQQSALGSLVTSVALNERSQQIVVQVIGGIASITMQPKITGNVISMEASNAELLGFGLPTSLVQDLIDLLTTNLQTYPLGLVPHSVSITDNGIAVSLSSTNADITKPTDGKKQSCAITH
ncbi:MAG: LmeA family phospholipid-binding protein [Mycobacteriaceae bacterium]